MEVEVNGLKLKIKRNLIDSTSSIPSLRDYIYKWLGRIGITKDYISIEHGPYPRDCWAEVKWQVNGDDYSYKCSSQKDNKNCLAAIEQLVHQEVIFIERGIKTFGQVMSQFRIGYEGKDKFIDPWQVLGVDKKIKDIDYITYKYKTKAKELHPDTGSGDAEKFKELQEAYTVIKKELESKK